MPAATRKIPAMDLGSTPLTGDELMEMVQNGDTVKIPANAFPPIGAGYITISNYGVLTGSRTLVAGSGISIIDNGPGSTLILASTGTGVSNIYSSSAPAAGTYNNVALAGSEDYILDVDTTAGNVNFSGFVAQRDGQRLTFTNRGANLLSFLSLQLSASGNQIRIPTDIAVVLNQSVTFQFSLGATKWLAM